MNGRMNIGFVLLIFVLVACLVAATKCLSQSILKKGLCHYSSGRLITVHYDREGVRAGLAGQTAPTGREQDDEFLRSTCCLFCFQSETPAYGVVLL